MPATPYRHRRLFATSAIAALLAGSALSVSLPATAADDPIDGAHTSGDPMFPNVGNGGYDALDYDIDIAWSPTGTSGTGSGAVVTGEFTSASATMTARALSPLRSFSLDFEGLTVDSVTVNGKAAAFEREIDPEAIKYKLIVTPATPVTGEFTVTVNYNGVPQFHTDADLSQEGWSGTNDGAMLLGQPIGMMTGFPHNNTPSDKATYTITVDAPTVLTNTAGLEGPGAVASNGELLSKVVNSGGDRTTWTWRQDKPMASELAVIAIGRFDVIESDVTLTDGRKIPAWSFMDYALSDTNKETIRSRVSQLETLIRNLESLYGPYPGNSTGVIVDTVPSAINYALETQDRSFFPSTNSVNGNTLIHEMIHQWYGDNVAPTTWPDIWMGEGMATWGPTFYNSSEGFGTGTLSELSYFNSWNRTAPTSASWTIPPGLQTDSAELYSYQTYTRSAQFWAALRIAIGDEAFFTLIKKWQVDNAGQSRSGADLKALAEEISGRDITALWNDWILEADKPAWPDKLSLTLTGGSETALLPGDSVSYTVTATNTGFVTLASSVVELDLSALVENAQLNALPEGASLNGTTLTWAVPEGTAVEASADLTITATVTDAAPGGTFATSARVASLGGTCEVCTVDTAVVEKLTTSQAPTISGDAVVGETLTATSTGWPEGTSLSYTWAVDGETVDESSSAVDTLTTARASRATPTAGGSGAEFVIPASALGSTVTVTVTGALDGFREGSVASNPTAPVRAAAIVGDEDDPAVSDTGDTSAPEREGTLSDTGAELPVAIALFAIVLLATGGVFVAARRRSNA